MLDLDGEEENHLRQREGNHCKVDTRALDGQPAKHPAKQTGGNGAGKDADFRCHPDVAHHHAADVARRAKKSCVTEGEQAGETEQEIKGAGEQRITEDFHQESRVDRKRGDQADNEQHSQKQRHLRFGKRDRRIHGVFLRVFTFRASRLAEQPCRADQQNDDHDDEDDHTGGFRINDFGQPLDQTQT